MGLPMDELPQDLPEELAKVVAQLGDAAAWLRAEGRDEDHAANMARAAELLVQTFRHALKAERRAIEFGHNVSSLCIAMQAACIDGRAREAANGMRWIENTLDGPGLLPNTEEAQLLGGAQAWFDAKTAENERHRAACETRLQHALHIEPQAPIGPMAPVRHASTNAELQPPPGALPSECQPLPITRVVYRPVGLHAVVSYWKPTPLQVRLLLQGKPVFLSVWGTTHPPVSVGVDGDGCLSS